MTKNARKRKSARGVAGVIQFEKIKIIFNIQIKTRSSWLNCALRDDEAVYWVSIGHYEAVAVGN